MDTLEIYLDDLKPDVQEIVLRFYGLGRDDNWDISPLVILDMPDQAEE